MVHEPDGVAPNESPSADDQPLVVQSRTYDPAAKPDLQATQHAVLRDSPKVRKTASYVRITDRTTGDYHHDALTLKTTKKLKAGDQDDEKRSITLSTEDGIDEIQKLLDFAQYARQGTPQHTGKFVILPTSSVSDAQRIADLLQGMSAAGRFDVLINVLSKAANDQELFEAIVRRAERDPELFANTAAALNLATYRKAVAELKALIEKPGVRESEFQALLAKNPWMFGSEYSELLTRRKWTRDEQKDFMVRRTTDGYIELIEIKTPLHGSALFMLDKSHDSPYAGADLSKAVGQVEKYLELLDAERRDIQAKDGEDTNKIRAKLVIGRDISDRQVEALRRYNGHLVRMEIITFDQLLRIAERVLGYLDRALKPVDGEPVHQSSDESSEEIMPF